MTTERFDRWCTLAIVTDTNKVVFVSFSRYNGSRRFRNDRNKLCTVSIATDLTVRFFCRRTRRGRQFQGDFLLRLNPTLLFQDFASISKEPFPISNRSLDEAPRKSHARCAYACGKRVVTDLSNTFAKESSTSGRIVCNIAAMHFYRFYVYRADLNGTRRISDTRSSRETDSRVIRKHDDKRK